MHGHTPDTQTEPEGHKTDLVIAQLRSTFHHLRADVEGSAHLSCQVSVPAAGPRGAQGVQVRRRSHAAVSQAGLLLPANCHPPHFTTNGTWSSALCHKTASTAHSLQCWHWHMVQCTLPQNSIYSTCRSWVNIARSILLLGSFMNTESLWVHLQTVHQIHRHFHLARMMERQIQNTPTLFWDSKCGLVPHSSLNELTSCSETPAAQTWHLTHYCTLKLKIRLFRALDSDLCYNAESKKRHVQSVAAQIKHSPCQRGL